MSTEQMVSILKTCIWAASFITAVLFVCRCFGALMRKQMDREEAEERSNRKRRAAVRERMPARPSSNQKTQIDRHRMRQAARKERVRTP